MRADTKIRTYKNSLTLTLSQREREFWAYFHHSLQKDANRSSEKSTHLPDELFLGTILPPARAAPILLLSRLPWI